jgi:hypothetical protein
MSNLLRNSSEIVKIVESPPLYSKAESFFWLSGSDSGDEARDLTAQLLGFTCQAFGGT